MKRKMLTLVILLLAIVSVAEAFEFPASGKTGLYTNTFGDDEGYRMIMYRDRDDKFVQAVVWYNGPCQDTVTNCVYRGWGEFLSDGSLLLHLFYRGSSIAPDETSGVGDFRISPDGTVTSPGIEFSMSLVFFGTNKEDGVYFTQQWGCTPPGDNGVPCKMRLLDETIGPWYLNWDMEVFSITDANGDSYFVLPAIGAGRTGMEYGWAHSSPDGIDRLSSPPWCPSWVFGNTPGCTGVSEVFPYGAGWWIESGPEDLGSPVSWINGRSVRATSRDPRVLEEYKRRGPVCYDPTIPGCFPE